MTDSGHRPRGRHEQDLGLKDALIIGCMQGVGVLPGVSRSGSTISGALFAGLNRKTAADFSFLMSIPAIIGGAVFEIPDALATGIGDMHWTTIVAGMLVAGITGYFAIKVMIEAIKKKKLIGFVIYAAAPTLIAAFNSDPAVVHYGVMQARTIALFYFLLAFSHCIAAVLRGSGNASIPMIVMLCVWCLFRVSYITVTVRLIPDIRVIFWAYPLTWSISSAIFLYLFLRGKWVYGFEKGGKR